MYTSSTESNYSVGVADYYSRKPTRPTSRLVALAPDLLLIAHCEGAPEAASYFTERLECEVTERMIKTVKTKVALSKLLITREELEKAAMSHPTMEARVAREPWLCDPQFYCAAITPEQDEVDLGANKKAATKKAAQVSKAKDIERKKPSEKPKPIAKKNSMKTVELPTGVSSNPDQKHLTDEEIQKASALMDADDEEDKELYS